MGLIINLTIASWEIYTGKHIMNLSIDYQRMFLNVPLGFFPNANDLSTVVFVSNFPLFIEYFESKSINWKVCLISIFVYSIYIVLKVDSRGALFRFCIFC